MPNNLHIKCYNLRVFMYKKQLKLFTINNLYNMYQKSSFIKKIINVILMDCIYVYHNIQQLF